MSSGLAWISKHDFTAPFGDVDVDGVCILREIAGEVVDDGTGAGTDDPVAVGRDLVGQLVVVIVDRNGIIEAVALRGDLVDVVVVEVVHGVELVARIRRAHSGASAAAPASVVGRGLGLGLGGGRLGGCSASATASGAGASSTGGSGARRRQVRPARRARSSSSSWRCACR